MTTGIEIARNPRFAADDLDYNFGTGKDACLQWDTAETNDALKLGLKVNNAAFSGNFIILNKDHIGSDTGLAASADPRLVVWSGDDPAAGGANEYLSLLHNRTDAVIATGAGGLVLDPAGFSIMVALAASHPAADPNAVHIWGSDSAGLAPIAGSLLVLELVDSPSITFKSNNVSAQNGLIFADPQDNDAERFTYSHGSDRFQFYMAGGNRLLYSAGAFAFQEATTISTTAGDLTLSPAGNVKFGTHTGIGAETVTGYITITDSGGASRKLAVVS